MYKEIHNIPSDFSFDSKNKSQIKIYGNWFKENKENRLNELITEVQNTKGYEDWVGNFSEESLKGLGKWLKENINCEKLSAEEYINKRNSVPDYIKIDDWDLTNRSKSILIDSGIYFGEVLIRNNKGLKWEQYFSKRKNDNDNGHIVIMSDIVETNPIWNFYIICLGLIRGKEDENSVYKFYEYLLENL